MFGAGIDHCGSEFMSESLSQAPQHVPGSHSAPRRSRPRYVIALVMTIVAGLASRHFPNLLPSILGKYPGDALWALMVFFGWGALFPRASSLRIAVLALATSWSVEFLKLWQTPVWSSIRHCTVGHLVFGHAFSWQNLLAYVLGVTGGLLIETMTEPRGTGTRA